jgi:hypothetical protein
MMKPLKNRFFRCVAFTSDRQVGCVFLHPLKSIIKKKNKALIKETGFLCVAQGGLELMILLPPPYECWDYFTGSSTPRCS